MADYAVNLDFWDKIQPKIRAWEIAHQREMPKSQYQALVEGELSVATNAAMARAERGRALDLEQEKVDLAKEQADKAASAAKIKGIADIGTTLGMGALTWKGLGIAKEGVAATNKLTEALLAGKSAVDLGPGLAAKESLTSLGGQAALTKTAPALATKTAFPTALETAGADAAAFTAGDAPFMASAAAPTVAPAGGVGAGTTAGLGAAGIAGLYIAGKYASDQLGLEDSLGKDWGRGVGMTLAPILAPVAFAKQAVEKGGDILEDIFGGSVVCSELLRQGRISKRDREWCVVFRHRHIDGRMFASYIEWASPHVSAMREGGWRNSVRLPFAHAFVRYMIRVAKRQKPTWFEKAVFAYAWRRCEKIAGRVPAGTEVEVHA